MSQQPTGEPVFCLKCNAEIGLDEVSHIDPRYHAKCFGELEVTETFKSKTCEDYDESTDTIIRRKDSFKSIQVSGKDWVWHTQRISELSDEELKRNIEYHRTSVYLIESLMSERQVEKFQKLRGQKVVIHKTVEVSGKKTVATKKSTAEDLLAKLQKLGLSPEQILAVLNKGNGGQP